MQKPALVSHWSKSVDIVFRVRLWDLDINGHVTNSRYLALMDLGRLQLMRSLGLLGHIRKNRWVPVLSTVNCSFIKEISWGANVTLRTRVLGFDSKYWFIQQQFYVQDTLHAQALCRGVFLGPHGLVLPEQVMAYYRDNLASNESSPPLPQFIGLWQKFLQEFKSSASIR